MAGSGGAEPAEEAPPPSGSRAEKIGETLGIWFNRAERFVRDPARRRTVIASGIGLVVLVALLAALPGLTRRAPAPPAAPPSAQPGAEQPAPPAAQPPAEGQPAPASEQAAPPAQAAQRQLFIAALPLLLGLFWLLSAWLVDAEARRAFVVQEPWGERRTVAYTALAVGCVFPLILAGLIFSAWGFVTFVLDVSRRQSPVAALQAAALILMAGAGFLVLRGLLARWLEQRNATRS